MLFRNAEANSKINNDVKELQKLPLVRDRNYFKILGRLGGAVG